MKAFVLGKVNKIYNNGSLALIPCPNESLPNPLRLRLFFSLNAEYNVFLSLMLNST